MCALAISTIRSAPYASPSLVETAEGDPLWLSKCPV